MNKNKYLYIKTLCYVLLLNELFLIDIDKFQSLFHSIHFLSNDVVAIYFES